MLSPADSLNLRLPDADRLLVADTLDVSLWLLLMLVDAVRLPLDD